jgi:hypothetical protein
MKTLLVACDICRKEITCKGWENQPRELRIVTDCTSQNPMAAINGQHQKNEYHSTEVCKSCVNAVARAVAVTMEALQLGR